MTVQLLRNWRTWWATRAPKGQFWIYFCAAIFFNLGFSIFVFLFNVYLLGSGMNERSLGLIGSAMAAGSLCGTIPAGILAQRFGLRWTLTGGVALACIASISRVLAVRGPAQFALAVLGGFALCTWGVCLSPAVAGLTTEDRRPAAFSLMFASGIGVAGIGGFAAGHLPAYIRSVVSVSLTLQQAERWTLLLACAIAALSLVPISLLTLRSAAARARLVRPSTPFLRKFLPAMAVWALVTGAFPPFASVYFVHRLGVSLEAMGSVFSLSQVVTFCAVLLSPLLFRRTGLANGIMLTQLVTAAMLLSLASVLTFAYARLLFWGYMGAQYMNEPGIYSLLMDRVPPADRNGASSYMSFTGAGAQIVASTIVGTLIVRFNYSVVLAGIGLTAVVAAVLFRRLPGAPEMDRLGVSQEPLPDK